MLIARRRVLSIFVFFALVVACGRTTPKTAETTSPTVASATMATTEGALPSWNDGPSRRALLDFVARATTEGADFVPPEDRVAVFDNDGTLWQEKPIVEVAFTASRLEQMAEDDPSLREKEPFKAALARDMASLHAQGIHAALAVFTATHTGMTNEVFDNAVRKFLTSARHPRFARPYTSLAYLPMLEVLSLLRKHDFSIYVCSAGDVDFMRVFVPSLYGIPPERVIGSRFEKEFVTASGQSTFLRKAKLETLNDKDAKPVNIDHRIGKRPIFAAGNIGNGGDIAMIRYVRDRRGPSFGMVIHHDDGAREVAYEEKDGATLEAARAYGVYIVSMQNDWKTVFPE